MSLILKKQPLPRFILGMTSVHILCTDPSFLGSSREKKQDCFLLKYFFFSLSSFDTFPSSNHPSLKRIQTIYNHITALFCLHLKVLLGKLSGLARSIKNIDQPLPRGFLTYWLDYLDHRLSKQKLHSSSFKS